MQPPIEDYALIGDCRSAALVSRHGSIDWLCWPDFSSPSLFAALVGGCTGGHFAIAPVDQHTVTRRYLDEMPVLETMFRSVNGAVRLLDFFPIMDGVDSLQPMREIMRIIEGVSGEVALDIEIAPAPNYAQTQPRLTRVAGFGWCYCWSNELLTIQSDVELQRDGKTLLATPTVKAGERVRVSMAYVKSDIGVLAGLGDAADSRLAGTLGFWRDWLSGFAYEGPYKREVLRSAQVLKLLTFTSSGAVVAAPTMALPEAIGGVRNWDYRYCWLRDAGMTMQAFVGLGFQREARCFLDWLLHATQLTQPELQVVYDVYGHSRLREQRLDHFEGYRGSKPVLIGNDAHAQRQLDIYGQVILAAEDFVDGGGCLEPVESRLLAGFGSVVCRQWRDPDHGIWEIRGSRRQYTYSKVMCWVALDRLLRLCEKGIVSLDDRERFGRERDAIATAIETHGFNAEISSYTAEFDGDTVDASLLLMPCVGYKPADHPRVISTFQCISERLGKSGLLYRYEQGQDGFDEPEGAFGLCSFWAVHHLAGRGDISDARRQFAHVLGFANDLGLFSEEFDPQSKAALGNFPQAFTHIGLINAALAIARAERSRR